MDKFIWLALMVVFMLAEATTVTTISLWFAGGALAALITSILGGPVWLQVVVFFVISGVLLAALRPMVRKHFKPKIVPTNVDSIIGTQGYVTEEINNLSAQGQVKLGSMHWTARSSSGEPIPAGTRIQADRIEGVKVYVSPAEVPAEA